MSDNKELWDFELNDKFSGVANHIGKSIDGVGGKFDAVGGAAEKAAGAWQQSWLAGKSIFDTVTSAIGSVIAAFEKVASVAWDVGSFAFDASNFKRDMLMSFELMEGSQDAAQKTWDVVKGFADRTPFDAAKVMGQFKMLRGGGFGSDEAIKTLTGLYDVSAMQGKEGAAASDRLVEALMKIKGTDRLDTETLKTLSMAGGGGLNMDQLFKTIADSRRVSLETAKQLVSSGQVKSDEATKAILDTVKRQVDKGDELGKAMEKFGMNSWEGLKATFKTGISSLFEDMDFSPVYKALDNINTSLGKDTDAGKQLRTTFNKMATDAGKMIETFVKNGGIEKILNGVVSVSKFLGDVWKVITLYANDFADGLFEGLSGFKEVLGMSTDFTKDSKEGHASVKALGKAFGDLAVDLAKVVKWLGSFVALLAQVPKWAEDVVKIGTVGDKIGKIATEKGDQSDKGKAYRKRVAELKDKFDKGDTLYAGEHSEVESLDNFGFRKAANLDKAMAQAKKELGYDGQEMGKSLTEGIQTGVEAGSGPLTDTLRKLGKDMVKPVNEANKIQSPSKVFAEVGRNLMAGVGVGVEAEAANTNDTLSSAIKVPAIGGGVGRGRGAVTVNLTLNVRGGPDAERNAEIIRRELEVHLPAILEGYAQEQGAA